MTVLEVLDLIMQWQLLADSGNGSVTFSLYYVSVGLCCNAVSLTRPGPALTGHFLWTFPACLSLRMNYWYLILGRQIERKPEGWELGRPLVE